jgi:stearoyl-CoA desaturase (delta-9 desaturase)
MEKSYPYNGKKNLRYKSFVLLMVVGPLIALVLAIILAWNHGVNWHDLVLLAVMYTLIAFGVTVGFHRMLTHSSFRPNPVIKCIFLILGSMAFEGPALEWSATHRKHHAKADHPGDPHSPVDGFWHAHFGWLFKDGDADPNKYCRDLIGDSMVVFISKTFLLWAVLSLVIPFAIGGWTGLLWAGLVRMFLTHHVTWSVNSVCHTFGKREFKTNDRSHNEWIVGLLGFGEGWHHNHHAFPKSAFHGLHWWQFDMSGYLIWTLEMFHLVDGVYRIPPSMMEAKKTKVPEGTS